MKKKKISILVLIMFSMLLFPNRDDSSEINNLQTTDVQSINDKKEQINIVKQNILLVNKTNRIVNEESLKELTTPNVRFIHNGDPAVREMEVEAAESLEKLFNAAENENIILLAVSGYRSYYYQETLYNDKVDKDGKEEAEKFVAQPGTSEHQTGLAMDLLSDEYMSLDEGFKNTTAYNWIMENCYNYGFIIRYPEGKETITGYNFEPWHIRYVGIEAAKEIVENGITLEEYSNLTLVNK